jgi:hypothetical protein
LAGNIFRYPDDSILLNRYRPKPAGFLRAESSVAAEAAIANVDTVIVVDIEADCEGMAAFAGWIGFRAVDTMTSYPEPRNREAPESASPTLSQIRSESIMFA